jgi:hypothetical protein
MHCRILDSSSPCPPVLQWIPLLVNAVDHFLVLIHLLSCQKFPKNFSGSFWYTTTTSRRNINSKRLSRIRVLQERHKRAITIPEEFYHRDVIQADDWKGPNFKPRHTYHDLLSRDYNEPGLLAFVHSMTSAHTLPSTGQQQDKITELAVGRLVTIKQDTSWSNI